MHSHLSFGVNTTVGLNINSLLLENITVNGLE